MNEPNRLSCFTKANFWLVILVIAIGLPTTAWAQLYAGSVSGTVSDPSGAVIPNARLQLVDEEKGYSFAAVTDSAGRYLVRAVPPGTYKLTVEAPGFSTRDQSGIKVDVNQNVAVNVPLQVGTATQTVDIRGEAAVLQTEDAVTGQVVNRKFINDLPLVSRSVTDLAFLTAGITEVDSNCAGCTANNFVSNGSRNATADMLMDGVSTTNFEQNSGIQVPTYTPSVDAVEEFVVEQSNFSAEYGFSGATIINMITRSGTNQFHGSAYDFLRNQKLDANNFFSNAAGIPLPPLRRNNFGATIGGPIRRDKTFFFFDYDGTRQASLSSFQAGVPSALERQGNFGELCANAGGSFGASGQCSANSGQLWDPYSGVYSNDAGGPVRSAYIPFNNLTTYMSPGSPKLNGTPLQLPATPGNLIDPVALKMMQYFPLPNIAVGTSAYNPYTNWQGSAASHSRNNQFDVKIDHRFNDHDLFSVKYSQQANSGDPLNCFGNAADPCDFGPGTGSAHLVAINHTHTFSPTVLLAASYGMTRGASWSHGLFNEAKYKGVSPSETLGLPQYFGTSGIPQLPTMELANYTPAGPSGANIGNQPWSYLRQGQETHHLLGTLSWVRGQHDFKFGAEGRMHRDNFTQPGTPGGLFVYDFSGTSEFPASGGGDALASFLTGVGGPGSWGQYEIPNYVSTQSFQAGGFVQDNWKVNKKLTLNIGLRYDVSTPRSERYNRMNEVSTTVVSPITAPGLGTLHGGEIFMNSNNRNNYNIDYSNLGPRFGLAYQVFDKTLIRGGYGIFYSTVRSGAAGVGPVGYQGYDQTTNWYALNPSDGATPNGRLSNPFPNGIKLPPGSSLGLLNDIGLSATGPIPAIDSATPYEQAWSFGIQRELPSSILLDFSYIGKKGTHLYFGGAGSLNYLGPQIEHYSASQISGLLTYVNNPFHNIITDPNSSLSSPKVPAYQLQLPFPQFTGVNGDDPPWANSIYNAMQIKVEKRFSRGLQFLVTYTWSKSIDDASATGGNITWLGGTTHLQDPNNRRLERGLSTFDIPSVLQFSYSYELPIGRGKAIGGNMHPVVNAVIGGWQTNGIWRFTDGRPIMLGLSGGQSLPTYGAQQPILTAVLRCSSSDRLTNYFANPEVLTVPAPFTLGNAPRTESSCRAPGAANANLSLFKEFSLTRLREGSKIQFRFETYNALNHPQFNTPNSTLNSGSFGAITRTANSPREAQVALKLYW
jgi:Carboxypeptidase regulatory-like domain/TonB dependent receptor